jgi:hypothetical protein
MSTVAPFYFRRRAIGRAASPPTWACYEQIPFDDDDDDYSDSGSDSCSEDDDDYGQPVVAEHRNAAPGSSGSDCEDATDHSTDPIRPHEAGQDIGFDSEGTVGDIKKPQEVTQVDIKGKQRAIDPPTPESTRRQHRKKQRKPSFSLRPILTIQRSQGFVWNQDLFVPPYIKDRYVASTSPPNCGGLSCSGMGDGYEVEVVEIRVTERDLQNIIP